MVNKLLLLLVFCIPLAGNSQDFLDVTVYNFQSPISSLFIENQPYFVESGGNVTNVSFEDLIVTISTEGIDMPNTWDAVTTQLSVLDGIYSLSPGDAIDLFVFMDLFLLDYEGLFDQGEQQVRIIATSANGAEVFNELFVFTYEFEPLIIPKPTFQIFDLRNRDEPADSMFIEFHFSPNDPSFFGISSIAFSDEWWVERFIAVEPITIRITNFDFFEFTFEGMLDPLADWRYEMFVNIYDPIDSLNSNQQIRFIAVNADCANGIATDIVDSPNKVTNLCAGADTVLTTFSTFRNVHWFDAINGIVVSGPTLEVNNIQGPSFLQIQAEDDEGCLFFDIHEINIFQDFDNIIQRSSVLSNYCPGETVSLDLIQGFQNPIWTNELTGETFTGNNLNFVFEEELVISVEATNSADCLLEDRVFLKLDRGDLANIFPEDFYYVCRGGSISLEANSQFTGVRYFNPLTETTIESSTLFLENVTEPVNIQVLSDGNLQCGFFQNIQFFPQNQESDELLSQSEYETCFGHSLTVDASDNFTDFRWFVPLTGQNVFDQSITFENVTTEFSAILTARKTGGDNCIYEQEIIVTPRLNNVFTSAILETDIDQNFCRRLSLEAVNGYIEYTWSLFDGGQFIALGNDDSIDLDFTDRVLSTSERVKLEVKDVNGCIAFYDFDVNTIPEEREIIVVTSPETYQNLLIPKTPIVCTVTNENNDNVIYWDDAINASNISEYLIYREDDSGLFNSIGSVAWNEENNYIDSDASANAQDYRYQVVSTNLCGYSSEPSRTHKTILLSTMKLSANNINLSWNNYEGIEYTEIKVLRGVTPSSLEEYLLLPSSVSSFNDQNVLDGNAYYQIEIVANTDCVSGGTNLATRSNVSAVLKSDRISELDFSGRIYPNPFMQQLHLDLDYQVDLQLISTQGKTVINLSLEAGQHKINTSDLTQGAYVLRLSTANSVYVRNFIKI